LHVAQSLTETPEANQGPVLTPTIEKAVLVQPGREPDHFPQPIDDRRVPMVGAGNDHMEAIGAEVDRGHDLGWVVRSGTG
jgi:hypothetical protein